MTNFVDPSTHAQPDPVLATPVVDTNGLEANESTAQFVTAEGQVIVLQSLALSEPEAEPESKARAKPKRQRKRKIATTSAAKAQTQGPVLEQAQEQADTEKPVDGSLAAKAALESVDAGAATAAEASSSEATAGSAELSVVASTQLEDATEDSASSGGSAQQILSQLIASMGQSEHSNSEQVVEAQEEPVATSTAVNTDTQGDSHASLTALEAQRAAENAAAHAVTEAPEISAEDQARYSQMGLKEGDPCPHCGKGQMVLRHSEHADFLGCSCFPQCKLKIFMHRLNQVSTLRMLQSKCPKCDQPLAVKKGRYGIFIGCSNYPDCTYVHKEQSSEQEIVCPQCHKGRLEPRRARSGRIFYGCNHYPQCNFVLPGKPVLSACPECGFSLRFQKKVKAGIAIVCGNPLCASRKRRKHEMLSVKE